MVPSRDSGRPEPPPARAPSEFPHPTIDTGMGSSPHLGRFSFPTNPDPITPFNTVVPTPSAFMASLHISGAAVETQDTNPVFIDSVRGKRRTWFGVVQRPSNAAECGWSTNLSRAKHRTAAPPPPINVSSPNQQQVSPQHQAAGPWTPSPPQAHLPFTFSAVGPPLHPEYQRAAPSMPFTQAVTYPPLISGVPRPGASTSPTYTDVEGEEEEEEEFLEGDSGHDTESRSQRSTPTQRGGNKRSRQEEPADNILRPFKCTHPRCKKAYSRKTDLQIHERTHTGERPFPCTHPGCGMAFKSKAVMVTHMRLHTGEKPFACPVPGCGARFIQRSNYSRHMHLHRKREEEGERDPTPPQREPFAVRAGPTSAPPPPSSSSHGPRGAAQEWEEEEGWEEEEEEVEDRRPPAPSRRGE